jgi:hypothetical protein
MGFNRAKKLYYKHTIDRICSMFVVWKNDYSTFRCIEIGGMNYLYDYVAIQVVHEPY